MPPVAGNQIVGGGFHRTLQDTVVRFVGGNHVREPPGFNDTGSLFQGTTSLGYAVFIPPNALARCSPYWKSCRHSHSSM